jgi:Sulfotransferase domain
MLREHPTVLSVSELFSFLTDLGMRIPRAFPAESISGPDFWELLSAPQPRQCLLLRHGLQMPEVVYPWERGRFTRERGLPPILQGMIPHLDSVDPDALYDALEPAMRALESAPIGDQYRALFGWLQIRMGKLRWAERSGGSLRAARRLLNLFPEARVLHVVRDGRNTALSMSRHIGFRMALIAGQQLEFLGRDPFETDDRREEEDLTEELAALLPERFSNAAFHAFELPPVLCGHYWSGEIIMGLQALQSIPAERLMTISYEGLLADPEGSIRRIGGFIEPHGTEETWVKAASGRVGKGRSSWRDLPESERRELDEACRPGFEALASLNLPWDEA